MWLAVPAVTPSGCKNSAWKCTLEFVFGQLARRLQCASVTVSCYMLGVCSAWVTLARHILISVVAFTLTFVSVCVCVGVHACMCACVCVCVCVCVWQLSSVRMATKKRQVHIRSFFRNQSVCHPKEIFYLLYCWCVVNNNGNNNNNNSHNNSQLSYSCFSSLFIWGSYNNSLAIFLWNEIFYQAHRPVVSREAGIVHFYY